MIQSEIARLYSRCRGNPATIGTFQHLWDAASRWASLQPLCIQFLEELHSFNCHYERYTPTTTQPVELPIACLPKHAGSIRINAYAAVAASISEGFAKVKKAANTVKRIDIPDITPRRIPGLDCVVTRCWSSQGGPINIARPSSSVIHVRPWSTIPPV